jgi:hypothetical protein
MKNFKCNNWIEESSDESLGFSFSLPKIKIAAPKVTIKKVIPKVVINTKTPLKTISKGVADGLKVINPLNQLKSIANSTPFTKNLLDQTDKVLGGSISSLTRVSNLSSKVLEGKGISKAEIMEAIMVSIKVGAIVASGGSSAALLSAGAGAMKNGPLGKSAFGKNLLTGVELVAGGVAVKDILEKQAEGVAAKEIENRTGIPVNILHSAYGTSKSTSSIEDFSKSLAKKVSEDQLKKAGLGNTMSQAILSGNAQALGVAISDAPNLAMDKAKREALALEIKARNIASVESIRSKAKEKADRAIAEAKDMQKLQAQIEKEKNILIKKELDGQFKKLIDSYSSNQKDALMLSLKSEIEAAKASLEIAAAQEGRYVSSFKTNAIVIGAFSTAVLISYLIYKGADI